MKHLSIYRDKNVVCPIKNRYKIGQRLCPTFKKINSKWIVMVPHTHRENHRLHAGFVFSLTAWPSSPTTTPHDSTLYNSPPPPPPNPHNTLKTLALQEFNNHSPLPLFFHL